MRKMGVVVIALCAALLVPVLANAVPMPWVVSNIDPEGSTTLVHDMSGTVLQCDFRVDLVLDVAGDGPDHPSNEPGEVGNPTDDDMLVLSWVSRPESSYLPEGAFAQIIAVELENMPIPPSASGYIRVFESAYPGQGSRYCNSEMFHGPNMPSEPQTVVRLPERMMNYLGNEPPTLIFNPWSLSVAEGDNITFIIRGEDTRAFWELLQFGFETDTLPGGAEALSFNRTAWDRLHVSYIPPFGSQRETRIRGWVDDGEYRVSGAIPISITAPGDKPSAFHLLSPADKNALWEDQGFSWGTSIDQEDQDITYTLYWSTNASFSDVDSMSGITGTSVVIPFQQLTNGSTDPELPNDVIQLGSDKAGRSRTGSASVSSTSLAGSNSGALSTSSATSRGRRAVRSGSTGALTGLGSQTGDAEVVTPVYNSLDELDVVEGDTVYWRVRAYDPDDHNRLAVERSWWAIAETPDAPAAFDLATPADEATLATLSPLFVWYKSENVDYGDEITYELHWSVNGSDTEIISGLTDTTFSFSNMEQLELEGAEDFYLALLGCFEAADGELNELPNHADVEWTVWAEDCTELRTQASDTWSFTIDAPDSPGGFTVASPANGTVFNRSTPLLLSWTEAVVDEGTVIYNVVGTNDPDVTDLADFSLIVSNLSETSTVFDPGQDDYTWWRWNVRAINDDDTTWAVGGSQPWAKFGISTPTRPEPFALVSPANGSQAPTTPTLRWDRPQQPDLDDPISYTLYYSLDNWATVDSIAGIPDTAFFVQPNNALLSVPAPAIAKGKEIDSRQTASFTSELDEFPEDATVVWKVRAADTNSRGVWCTSTNGWSFTTYVDEPPLAFSLSSPEDEFAIEDSSAVFSWEASSDPEGYAGLHYKLFISDNPEFEDADSLLADGTQLTVSMVGRRVGDYWWRVAAIDSVYLRSWSRETWTVHLSYVNAPEKEEDVLPTEFAISAAYPNPFNPTLNVVIAAPQAQRMQITVFDILGRNVMSLDPAVYQPGYHPVHLDFSHYPSGVYFVRLDGSRGMIQAKKVVLLK